MKLLEISKKIKRNIKVFMLTTKYVFMREMAYPFSVWMGFAIDLLYQVGYILIYVFLFNDRTTVAGWTEAEMILLLSIQMFFTELFVSVLTVYNFRELPDKIRKGEVDFVLLKPVSSMMQLTVGEPYLPALVPAFVDFLFVIYAVINLGITFDFLRFLSAFLVFVFGSIIVYSVSVIILTISFYNPDNTSLVKIVESFAIDFVAYPRNIYKGVFRIIFYFILPIVYVSSYPAEFLISGPRIEVIGIAAGLAVLFFSAAVMFWNRAIKNYSSASS